jgi:hypothetical protein
MLLNLVLLFPSTPDSLFPSSLAPAPSSSPHTCLRYANRVAPYTNGGGYWFATVNLCVHSIMVSREGGGGDSTHRNEALKARVCWGGFVVRHGPLLSLVQYTYFALRAAGFKKLLRAVAADVIITSIQLAQMLLGVAVLVTANRKCELNDETMNSWGLAMYVSYIFLFGKLFYDKYIGAAKKERREESEGGQTGPMLSNEEVKKAN